MQNDATKSEPCISLTMLDRPFMLNCTTTLSLPTKNTSLKQQNSFSNLQPQEKAGMS